MNRYIIATLALVALVSCQKVNESVAGSGDRDVVFTSSSIISRTAVVDGVDVWEFGDKIGVSTVGFDADYTNVCYVTSSADASSSAYFAAFDADSAIEYPEGSGSVSFYAYYPYAESAFDDGVVTVSIDGQKGDIGAVYFMTASGEASYTSGFAPGVQLAFEHRLSKVVLNITVMSGLPEIVDFSAKMTDVYCEAQYDIYGAQVASTLAESKEIDVTSEVASDNRTVTVTAILHPGDYNGKPRFFIDGYTYELEEFFQTFAANTVYTYQVFIGADNVAVSGSTISPWDSDDYEDIVITKEAWDGVSVATSFNGVAYDPEVIYSYEITSGAELAYLAQIVNSGDKLEGMTFTMLNNIDLGDNHWTSIGEYEYSDDYYFNGTFDGDGYTIKRLYIGSDDWHSGLFIGLSSNGTIKNLNVEGNLLADGYCGGIVGLNDGGTIDNCSFDGTIDVSNYGTGAAGGIAGSNECGVITNCYNKGTITGSHTSGTDQIGGIAGSCRGAWDSGDEYTGKIYACYNLGTITSTDGDVIGGIVGYAMQGAVIESCFNEGNVSGDVQVGGIVGFNTDSEVINVYNTGEVSGSYNVGGVVGQSSNWNTNGVNSLFTETSCKYAYNVGNVIVDGATAAGVIGQNDKYASYCYAEELFDDNKVVCGYYNYSSGSYIVVYSSSDAIDSNIESLSYNDMVGGELLSKLSEYSDGFISDDANYNNGYPILKAINY